MWLIDTATVYKLLSLFFIHDLVFKVTARRITISQHIFEKIETKTYKFHIFTNKNTNLLPHRLKGLSKAKNNRIWLESIPVSIENAHWRVYPCSTPSIFRESNTILHIKVDQLSVSAEIAICSIYNRVRAVCGF